MTPCSSAPYHFQDQIVLGSNLDLVTAHIAQRELRKVPLQVIVAPYSAISRNNKKFLILGPTKASDRAFVPLRPSVLKV
jgi:hypothetical protein